MLVSNKNGLMWPDDSGYNEYNRRSFTLSNPNDDLVESGTPLNSNGNDRSLASFDPAESSNDNAK